MPFAQGPPHQQVAQSTSQVMTSSGPDSPIGPPSTDTFVSIEDSQLFWDKTMFRVQIVQIHLMLKVQQVH